MKSSYHFVFSFLSLIGIFSLAFSTSVPAAQFSEQLESTLSTRSNGDFVSVLVFMADRADIKSFQAQYKPANFTRQAAHEMLIDELKSYAQDHQTQIVNDLNAARIRGEVRSFQTYWITNALQLEARKSFIESLRNRPDIAAVIEDLPMQSLYYPPSQATAVSPTQGVPPNLRAIHADSMWALGYTGAGRLVASFDTGVNGLHPALRDSYHGNHGFSSAESWFDPVYSQNFPHAEQSLGQQWSHGTETMSVMVGMDLSGDTTGVAFGAQWISAMVVDVPGANYLEAFQWVADPDGDPNTVDDVPDVVNNSWGFRQTNINCLDIFWDPIDNVEAAGAVVVFACGNEGPGIMTLRNPANRATTPFNSFSVGAVSSTNTDSIWVQSSRGPSDCDSVSIKPEVTAPGYGVKVAYADTLTGYVLADGTSFAAPHVAGAVALLREYNPNAPVDSIKSALMRSAVDKGDPGEDNTFGWGVIDIPAAMNLLAPNNQIHIYVQGAAHDPINPGDVVDVVVTLRNSGLGTTGVTGQLTNPQSGVTIESGFASFGSLPIGGAVNNASTPYRLAFSSSITPGTRLAVDLQVQDGFEYQRTIPLEFTVGTALVKSLYTLETDSCRFTVTNYGTYGLAPGSILNKGGSGFTFPASGINNLFQCGLVIGVDTNHVSDGIVNQIGSVDDDFIVAPGGNLTHFTGGHLGDAETLARFVDDHARNPLGLVVEQRTATFSSAADANYVIMQFVFTNSADTAIANAYVGLYCDWDFPWGYGSSDRTGFSRDYNLGYTWQHGPVINSYRGTAVLNREGVHTYYAIKNLGNVYDQSGNGLVTEATKYRFLTHGIIDTASALPYDQSYCIATGPFNLAPGATDTACFIMVAGADLADLQVSVASARAHYGQATPVDGGGEAHLPSGYKLGQNHPNPFNPQTLIVYTIPRPVHVSLSVFNTLGQQVATLIDAYQTAGDHVAVWDGLDSGGKPAASGVYFYRLQTGDFSQTRKMILLK